MQTFYMEWNLGNAKHEFINFSLLQSLFREHKNHELWPRHGGKSARLLER